MNRREKSIILACLIIFSIFIENCIFVKSVFAKDDFLSLICEEDRQNANGYYSKNDYITVSVSGDIAFENMAFTDTRPVEDGDFYSLDKAVSSVKICRFFQNPVNAKLLSRYSYVLFLKEPFYQTDWESVSQNITDYAFFDVKIDETAPDLRAHSDSDRENDYYYRTIKAVAADKESGVDAKNGFSFSYDEEDMKFGSADSFTARKNGTVYICVKDNVGNVSETEYLVEGIDDKAPVIKKVTVTAVSDVESGSYGKYAKLSFVARDEGVGLDEDGYIFCPGPSFKEEKTVYSQKGEFEVSQNGIFTIGARDKKGNTVTSMVNVTNIDDTAPSISVTGNPSDITDSDVFLTISARDEKSGIASLWYEDGGVKSKSLIKKYDGETVVKEKIEISQNGEYIFHAYDRIGNEAEFSVRVSAINRNYKKGANVSSTENVYISGTGSNSSLSATSQISSVTLGTEKLENDDSDESENTENVYYIGDKGNNSENAADNTADNSAGDDNTALAYGPVYYEGDDSFDEYNDMDSDINYEEDGSNSNQENYSQTEGQLRKNNSEGDSVTSQVDVVYPVAEDSEKEEKIPVKAIVVLGIIFVLILTMAILNKMGIIDIKAMLVMAQEELRKRALEKEEAKVAEDEEDFFDE